MRRLFAIAIILGATLVSCKTKEQIQLEREVSKTVSGSNSFTKMEVAETILLSDVVKENLILHKSNLSWSNSFYDAFKDSEQEDDKLTASEYKERISKEQNMITFLESIEDSYPDLFNSVAYTVCKLSYLHPGPEGKPILDLCFGRFNKDGRLVAFKPTGTSKWEVLEDYCPIPGCKSPHIHIFETPDD